MKDRFKMNVNKAICKYWACSHYLNSLLDMSKNTRILRLKKFNQCERLIKMSESPSAWPIIIRPGH